MPLTKKNLAVSEVLLKKNFEHNLPDRGYYVATMTMQKLSLSKDDAFSDKRGDKKSVVEVGNLSGIEMVFVQPEKPFFVGSSTGEVA